MVHLINSGSTIEGLETTYPLELTALSTDTLPADCPIMSTIFVVDKLDVVFCGGDDNWYREADTPVAAGQPISALF